MCKSLRNCILYIRSSGYGMDAGRHRGKGLVTLWGSSTKLIHPSEVSNIISQLYVLSKHGILHMIKGITDISYLNGIWIYDHCRLFVCLVKQNCLWFLLIAIDLISFSSSEDTGQRSFLKSLTPGLPKGGNAMIVSDLFVSNKSHPCSDFMRLNAANWW